MQINKINGQMLNGGDFTGLSAHMDLETTKNIKRGEFSHYYCTIISHEQDLKSFEDVMQFFPVKVCHPLALRFHQLM